MEKLETQAFRAGNGTGKGKLFRPEILAPAGSMDALKAAISAGADAVYIGGQSFGARAFADNPDRDELLAAIAYVHLRKKRLYLTVNTLIKEQEFGALYEFLAPFYEAGLDAVIVQDVGALRFIAREFPGLSIHASTQMTLTSADGLSLFSGYPVTRLVPARELSLTEIKALCDTCGREVEIFVHGALCYCYSGQCLMSSMIGGRSGNRGRCAQPCRMEYKTADGGSGYFLSPKDLCGLSLLPELIETGAASFKIEGRMKRPEYAAAVAAAYRTETDRYFSLGKDDYRAYCREHPDLIAKKIEELADVYNRGGFTTGCFQKKNGPELMSMKRPGHFGVPVGTVTADSVGKAEFVLDKDVFAQDVLEFRKKNGAKEGIPGYYEYTLGTGAAKGSRLSARMLPKLTAQKGDLVYRMRNTALLERIADNYLKREAKVPAEGYFYAKSGEVCTLILTAQCNVTLAPKPFSEGEAEPVSVTAQGFVCEKAGKLPATEESVKKQLCKTGNEEFVFEELTIALADDVFLPNGLLNELRRSAFAMLTEAIKKRFVRAEGAILSESRRYEAEVPAERQTPELERHSDVDERKFKSEKESVFIDCVVSTKAQAKAAADASQVRRIYADLCEYAEQEVSEILRELKKSQKEVYYCLPRIARLQTMERLKKELPKILDLVDGFLVRNLSSVELLCKQKDFSGKRLVLDTNLYVMNREAQAFYREALAGSVFELTAPQELSERELSSLDLSEMTMVVYGRIPLMVSAHCVKKNTMQCRPEECGKPLVLSDRVGKDLFCQQFCKDCYNVIYNPETLNLLTEETAIRRLLPRAVRLDFTFESAEEVGRILKQGFFEGTAGAGFTRGHFKRGVD